MSKTLEWSFRQHGLINNEIPLTRYFLIVGGALLVLLFAVDAITPREPKVDSANSGPRLPRIRIHSEQKGPEAVVIDTSQPIVVPTLTTEGRVAKIESSPEPQLAEKVPLVSPSLRQADAKELSKAERKPPLPKKIARAVTKPPPVSYVQQADVGPFDGAWTFHQQNARIRDSFARMVPRQQRQGGASREIGWARTEHTRRQHFGWFDTPW